LQRSLGFGRRAAVASWAALAECGAGESLEEVQ
jgi:hypothetical protein